MFLIACDTIINIIIIIEEEKKNKMQNKKKRKDMHLFQIIVKDDERQNKICYIFLNKKRLIKLNKPV